jgi:predicted Fe-Mo cluster-binding NifX family protein
MQLRQAHGVASLQPRAFSKALRGSGRQTPEGVRFPTSRNGKEHAWHGGGSPCVKLAMPVSAGRISTAFDFARHLLVVEHEDGREVRRSELVLEEELPLNRARRLEALGASVLICGAISRSAAERLADGGIDIIPFVSGPVEEVLTAYFAGELESARFLMPGSTYQERTEWRLKSRAR